MAEVGVVGLLRVFKLDDSALDAIEPQILTAVKSAAHRPDSVPPGEFRAAKEQDQSGRDITKFVGPESFVREFHRPGRLARIRSPDNYMDRPFFR